MGSLFILCFAPGLATASTDTQGWSILRKDFFLSQGKIGIQLQHRYSFNIKRLYEEQINLDYHQKLGKWTLGGILTLGTVNGYERIGEHRLALEAQRASRLARSWLLTFRNRVEFRDFVILNQQAVRYRFRVQGVYQANFIWLKGVEMSVEPQFYLSEFSTNRAGFSSFRSILGLDLPTCPYADIQLFFLNDYREFKVGTDVRNSIGFSAVF